MPKGNPNIRQVGRRFTKENAKEMGRKAGIASGKAKRNKKLLKDCLEILLEQKVSTKDGKKVTGAEATAAALFKKALNGDTKAFELLRDTAGQKPIDKIEQINANIDIDFSDLSDDD